MKRLLCLIIFLVSCSEPQIGRDFNRDTEQGAERVRTLKIDGYDSLDYVRNCDVFYLQYGM
jgi:hypothetical protein